MSYVLSVVLEVGLADEGSPQLAHVVNAFDLVAGPHRRERASIYTSEYNYAGLRDEPITPARIAEMVGMCEWLNPGAIVLTMTNEHDDGPAIWAFADGELVCLRGALRYGEEE